MLRLKAAGRQHLPWSVAHEEQAKRQLFPCNKDLVSYVSHHQCLRIMQVSGVLKVLQKTAYTFLLHMHLSKYHCTSLEH